MPDQTKGQGRKVVINVDSEVLGLARSADLGPTAARWSFAIILTPRIVDA